MYGLLKNKSASALIDFDKQMFSPQGSPVLDFIGGRLFDQGKMALYFPFEGLGAGARRDQNPNNFRYSGLFLLRFISARSRSSITSVRSRRECR
jgi:hypothetical protein